VGAHKGDSGLCLVPGYLAGRPADGPARLQPGDKLRDVPATGTKITVENIMVHTIYSQFSCSPRSLGGGGVVARNWKVEKIKRCALAQESL
jgi:hypothetical protein